jgi:hypothetical protein
MPEPKLPVMRLNRATHQAVRYALAAAPSMVLTIADQQRVRDVLEGLDTGRVRLIQATENTWRQLPIHEEPEA